MDHGGDPVLIAVWCADKTPEHLRDALSHAENLWLVAVDGADSVTGVGSLGPGGKVTAIYVDPEMVHRGIGKMLLDSLEAEAVQRGLEEVTLLSSRTALPFYERCGFAPAGQPQTFRAMTTYPMRKALRRDGA